MSESGTGGDRRPPTDERSGGGSPPFDAGERFELRRRLGEGGMGVVFEAFDRERRETVALKSLQRTKGHLIPHFKREFRALHDVAHRNLVGLGELLEGPDGPFFTMELVPGEDLLAHEDAPSVLLVATARPADTPECAARCWRSSRCSAGR